MGEAVGLVAGEGKLPVLLARAIRARGFRLVCVQVAGDPRPVRRWCHVHASSAPGEVGRILQILEDHGVRSLVLAGKVDKLQALNSPLDPLAHELLQQAAGRADSELWRAMARLLTRRGFEVLPQPHFLPELLMPPGVLGTRVPTDREWRDLRHGFELARKAAELGIGQAVAVRDGVVLAVEAAEGTDGMIRRLRAFGSGAVVVKASSPDQDPRFDLPTIGPTTVALLHRVGATALGIEAERALLLDRPRVVARAEAAGIALVGL